MTQRLGGGNECVLGRGAFFSGPGRRAHRRVGGKKVEFSNRLGAARRAQLVDNRQQAQRYIRLVILQAR